MIELIEQKKEIRKYGAISFKKRILTTDETLRKSIEIFNESLNKISKKQFKNGNKLDEFMEIVEDKEYLEEQIQEQKKDIKKLHQEVEDLIKMLIFSLDTFENMYRYVKNLKIMNGKNK